MGIDMTAKHCYLKEKGFCVGFYVRGITIVKKKKKMG